MQIGVFLFCGLFVGFQNLKLNLTNVIGVTSTVAKEIAAKQPELPF
jgi:hypothetical protein